MKVFGKKVSFGRTTSNHHFDMYYGGWDEVNQRWDIPSLNLYGFIDPRDSLSKIKQAIEKEVRYDLEQRKKRAQGIDC